MADNPNSRRWLAISLVVAIGLLLVALLPRWRSDDTRQERSARDLGPTGSPEAAPLPDVLVHAGDGVRAARRVAEVCDPIEESLEYEDLVDQRALAILSWTGMSEEYAANLRIPVYVVGIQEDAIGVRFLKFPMREQYLHVWLGSGHIRATTGDVFLLEPCSAALEPWPVELPD